MGRAGFGLVVNDKNDILLIRHDHGRRKGKWGLPGGRPKSGEGRRDAAIRETDKSVGIKFTTNRLYYENRHRAQVWLGKPKASWLPWNSKEPKDSRPGVSWFSIDKLPDDDSLAFAVDVRTVEKWASENSKSRRVRY